MITDEISSKTNQHRVDTDRELDEIYDNNLKGASSHKLESECEDNEITSCSNRVQLENENDADESDDLASLSELTSRRDDVVIRDAYLDDSDVMVHLSML